LISQATIQQILDAARIEEVIGDFVMLKRRGINLTALCPFHNEKTPSFHVSPVKGIYKCFGCGKAGNSVNFLMEHEHYSYPEALKYLAKKYDIEIEETEKTPEDEVQADERESLYNLLTFAQKYFSDNLFTSREGMAIGKTYFEQRGFSEQIIKKFQLGYGSEKWEEFTRHALDNGYKPEYLTKAGLSASRTSSLNEQINNLYDVYRGRVIFPIHNLSGRVIGFGGRILSGDKTKPKYINSPESLIYHKSDVLYGIFYAKNSIIKNNNCYLVEGYTDVISLHQSGIENVVASSGTSLTTGQIKLIKRYTQNITILYDGDEAGIKASFRGIDMILQEGMNVRVVLFPEGEDPDSYARERRPQEVNDFINSNSSDFIAFKTSLLLKETGDDPVKKSSLIKEILSSISLIPDIITRTEYIKECGRLMNIPEQTLISALNKLLTRNAFKRTGEETRTETLPETTEYTAEKQIAIEEDRFASQEKEIIRILLTYSDKEISFQMEDPEAEGKNKRLIDIKFNVADYIIENLKDDTDLEGDPIKFNNSSFQKIFDEVAALRQNNLFKEEGYFLNHTDEEIRNTSIDILTSQYSLSRNWEEMHKIIVTPEIEKLREAVKMAVMSLKLKRLNRMRQSLNNKIKDNPENEELQVLYYKMTLIGLEIEKDLGRFISMPKKGKQK
jgi:DNA primase